MEESPPRTVVNERPEHVTIIREGRGSGGVLVAIIALVLIAAAAFWVFGSNNQGSSDSSISAAADKVGAAAEKVGNVAESAEKRMTE